MMSSTLIAITTLVPLFLIIFLTVFFIRRQSRKKSEKKKAQFISYCRSSNLQVEYVMQRRYAMAALSIKTRQIAWTDLSVERMKDPLILSLQSGGKHRLRVTKNKSHIQKIALRPAYAPELKDDPEIIFYDWLQDDETQLEDCSTEAEKWEEALRNV